MHRRVFALGERMRDGPARDRRRARASPPSSAGYGSLFVLCFMEGPLESYDDVLRNDNALFVRYRRELDRARRVRDAREPRPQPHQRVAHGGRRRSLAELRPRKRWRAALDDRARRPAPAVG